MRMMRQKGKRVLMMVLSKAVGAIRRFALIVLILSVFPYFEAQACKCGGTDPKKAYSKSNLVFVGSQVSESIKTKAGVEPNKTPVTFSVYKVLKGRYAKEQIVLKRALNVHAMCQSHLVRRDGKYVVFAVKTKGGYKFHSDCYADRYHISEGKVFFRGEQVAESELLEFFVPGSAQKAKKRACNIVIGKSDPILPLLKICRRPIDAAANQITIPKECFRITNREDPQWGKEQDWWLVDNKILSQLKLEQLFISFEQGVFRAITLQSKDPKKNRLSRVGLTEKDIKLTKKGRGSFSAKDAKGLPIYIDADWKSFSCFEHRPGH